MVIKENQPNSETSTTEDNKEVKTKTDEQPPKEENKKEETETETKTKEKEQPKKEIKKEKEEKVDTYKESLAKVVAQYNAELKKEREEHKRDVDERDEIIAQLVTDTKASAKTISGRKTISERIAERRNYKKW